MPYRESAKPAAPHAPMRWHRWSIPGAAMLWLAYAVAYDVRAFEGLTAVQVWCVVMCIAATLGALWWSAAAAIEKRW